LLPLSCVICLVCLLMVWAAPEADPGGLNGSASTATSPGIETNGGLPGGAPGHAALEGQGGGRVPETDDLAVILPVPGAPRAARLAGRVRDAGGVGHAAALVILQHGSRRLEMESGPDGAFAFEDLGPGRFRLFVEQRSLAPGFLAPWRQSVQRPYTGIPTGVHGTSFQLRGGDDRTVDLLVQRAASLRGNLVGPQGEPIAGALISLSSAQGPHFSTRSDEGGRYGLERIHPGSYDLLFSVARVVGVEPGSTPLPQKVSLAPGESYDVPPLRFGGFGHCVRGRVVDAAGRPVVGLTLVCEQLRGDGVPLSWRVLADGEGAFCFGLLPPAPVVLRVARADERTSPNEPVLADLPAPMSVALEGPPKLVDVGELRVQLAPTFILHGRVEVNPDWVRKGRLDPYTLELLVPDPLAVNGTRVVEIGTRRGEFRWSCRTPSAAENLSIVFRSGNGEESRREFPVVPVGGELKRVVVRFP
jgi:hypothetical protein